MSKHNRQSDKFKTLKTETLDSIKRTEKNITTDGFANFAAKLGMNADNLISQGHYNLSTLITRNRTELEAAYRSSWIIGQVTDIIAEDMTREGIEIISEHKPEEIIKLHREISNLGIMQRTCETIKWARLFGGAIAVMLIDGQDFSTPLKVESIRKGQFKGLYTLDRWRVWPTFNELIDKFGPDYKTPKYYQTIGDPDFPMIKIHHSRVMRIDGIELPYFQKLAENRWGLSVIERMYDRLIAFDSTTHGIAQLVFIAYLRKIGVKGLREALSMGGKAEETVIKQFDYIRQMQSNMGITLLDEQDNFETQQYTFAGLSDVLERFAEQLAGATGIPLVRLFGMTPAGFSNGESDLRNYYDHVNTDHENHLRYPFMSKIMPCLCMSVLGEEMPEDFDINFPSLWQMDDKDKSDIANVATTAIVAAYNAGIISQKQSLKELKQQSKITGIFSNITDEDIEAADDEVKEMLDIPGFGDEGKKKPEKGEGK